MFQYGFKWRNQCINTRAPFLDFTFLSGFSVMLTKKQKKNCCENRASLVEVMIISGGPNLAAVWQSCLFSRWWVIKRVWMSWSGPTLCSCSSACPPFPSCWSSGRWSVGRITSCVCGGSTPTNCRSSTASSQVRTSVLSYILWWFSRCCGSWCGEDSAVVC